MNGEDRIRQHTVTHTQRETVIGKKERKKKKKSYYHSNYNLYT
jgi:hypothetical protein